MAELISLCAQLRAEGDGDDGPAWAATVALLGHGALTESDEPEGARRNWQTRRRGSRPAEARWPLIARPTRVDRAPRARGRARPCPQGGRPVPRDRGDRRSDDEGRGPALLFENPKGSSVPLLINAFGPSVVCRLRSAWMSLEDARARHRAARARPAHPRARSELAEKARRAPRRYASADRRADGSPSAACQEVVLIGDDDRSHGAARDPHCWPNDGGPFITLPDVITNDPDDRRRATSACTGCSARTAAPRRCTGRSTRRRACTSARDRTAAARGARVALGGDPGLRLRGDRAAADGDRRVHVRRLPARRAGRAWCSARRSTCRCPPTPRSSSKGYVDPGETARRGPVRRPHRLLLAGRAVPASSTSRHHDARRTRSTRRPSSASRRGGLLTRQGDRADLPAAAADDRPRHRRLRPADRGRLPQLRDRLDPQAVTRSTRRRSCTRSGAPAR